MDKIFLSFLIRENKRKELKKDVLFNCLEKERK